MNKIYNILAIMTGFFFGSVGIFIRTLYDAGFSSISIISTRFAGAVILLLPCILIKDRSLLKIRLRDCWIFIACGLGCNLITNICFNISSTQLSLSLAATLLAIFPIYVLFVSAIFFHEKITGKKILCLILAIAGCVLVTGVIGSDVSLSRMGIVAGIISGISYGMYGIFSRFGIERGYRGLTITFYSLVAISIGTLPFTDFKVIGAFISQAPLQNIGFMFLHSLCVGVLSYLTYTIAIEHIDPGKASILASCEPVAAMIFGLIFYQEIPTVFMIGGLILMLVALTVMCAKEKETA